MTQGYTDFYQFESLWKIMKGEEKRGKLQTDLHNDSEKRFLFKSHCFNFFNRTAYVSNYQDSLFYRLEETLKKEKLTKYNE